MVEFCGELSDKCKSYILRNEVKIPFISSLITAIVLSIPIVIATIMCNWIFVIAILVLVLYITLASLPPKKNLIV